MADRTALTKPGQKKPAGQVFILHTWKQSVKNEDLAPMFSQTMWYLHSHTVCDKLFFICCSFLMDQPRPILRNGAFLLNTTA